MREEVQASTNPAGARRPVTQQQADSVDITEYAFILLGHWWQIVLSAVLCAALFFGYTFFNEVPVYRATAKMYLVSSSGSILNMSELSLSNSLKPDLQELMRSRPLMERVIENLDLPYTSGQLSGMISVSNPTNTRIMHVTVTSRRPAEAADIANGLVSEARDYLSDIMKIDPPSFYEPAVVPRGKVGSGLTNSAMIGAALGAALCGGTYILLAMMNDKLVTPDDVAKYLGVTPLTTIPEAEFTSARKKQGGKAAKKNGGGR